MSVDERFSFFGGSLDESGGDERADENALRFRYVTMSYRPE